MSLYLGRTPFPGQNASPATADALRADAEDVDEEEAHDELEAHGLTDRVLGDSPHHVSVLREDVVLTPGKPPSSSAISWPSALVNSGCFVSATLGVAKIRGHPKSAM